jgi:hypothetical protein
MITADELSALDDRAIRNGRGQPTDLQRLGAAVYKSGRFSGFVAPSRYSDIVSNYSFNFLPDKVEIRIRDVEKVLESFR